ncbi:retrotransposon protein [Cucumis melo var. makuwa]|uniref:Retrotransposon protein n=1 Tax=Cucumis melo var. makuwa TaxID=1194695 RepID=A0A5A7VE03_CUCMM|nr:retrotransposon protein [Cucumis melo var. makuwa]TYK05178.1 retrotransposon protein [Cucumis melo var. makuwa]
MSTSTRPPRHVWTKEEEGTLMKYLIELVSMGDENPIMARSDQVTWPSWETGRFAETFAEVGFNEPGGYEGFDMVDGNEEFPPVYSQGIDMSHDDVRIHLALDQTNEQLRMIAEWPARALAKDNHMRTEFFCILREMPELTILDRALLQRHLLSRIDDLRGIVLMLEDDREGFCRVLLRDMTR